jgi:hypothetical protein
MFVREAKGVDRGGLVGGDKERSGGMLMRPAALQNALSVPSIKSETNFKN